MALDKFDWARYAEQILAILDDVSGDKTRAAEIASKRFRVPVSRHGIARFLRRHEAGKPPEHPIVVMGSAAAEIHQSSAPRAPYLYERAFSTTVAIPPPKRGTMVVFSDIHFPFQHKLLCRIAVDVMRDLKPEYGVMNGDAFDFYMISDFERDPAQYGVTLQHEFDVGREFFEQMAQHCRKTFMILGNHEFRLGRLLAKNPGLWGLRSLDLAVAAELPKSMKVFPYLTKLRFGDLTVHHGSDPGKNRFGSSQYLAAAAYRKHNRSILVGHHHREDFFFARADGRDYRAHVSGTMADPEQLKYIDEPNWTLGFSVVHFWTDAQGGSCFKVEPASLTGDAVLVNGKLYR